MIKKMNISCRQHHRHGDSALIIILPSNAAMTDSLADNFPIIILLATVVVKLRESSTRHCQEIIHTG
jgi:hypothetical protein